MCVCVYVWRQEGLVKSYQFHTVVRLTVWLFIPSPVGSQLIAESTSSEFLLLSYSHSQTQSGHALRLVYWIMV